LRATTRLQLSASLTHPSSRLPPPTPPSGFGTPRLGPSPLATWRSGDLLLSPSARPMRCPGAVTPPRRLARGSVRPRPASSPEERILRQPSGSLTMPRSEDRLAARLPSFRRRGLGRPPSTPYKDVEEPEPCLSRGARKRGVCGRGRGRASVALRGARRVGGCTLRCAWRSLYDSIRDGLDGPGVEHGAGLPSCSVPGQELDPPVRARGSRRTGLTTFETQSCIVDRRHMASRLGFPRAWRGGRGLWERGSCRPRRWCQL
jgi:hypothetical protein